MAKSFKRLERVLELEKKQGYQNKAVVGGIRQFAIFWVGQAREEAKDEADRALVEQVSELLMDYARLPGKEARAKAIQSLTDSLQRRWQRQQDSSAKSRPRKSASPKEDPQSSPAKPTTKAQKIAPKSAPAGQQPAHRNRRKSEREPRRSTPKSVRPDPQGLAQPVTALKGVGEKTADQLARLDVTTILDMLYLFPRRYDDYTLMKSIKDLVYDEQITIIGTIWETRARRTRNNQVMVQSIINDGSGSIQATWFNQPWLADKLPAGMQIVLSGKVDQYLGRFVFNNPEWEPLELDPLRTRRIVPVYPLTQGLSSNKMRDIMRKAVTYWSARVADPLPQPLVQRLDFFPLHEALYQNHFPDSQECLHKARKRLVFDELFLLQLGMQRQKREWQAVPSVPLQIDPASLIRYRNLLPYMLTGAQQRVIEEILADLGKEVPMNRLLQGDVGSGKTAVAAAALVATVAAGAQAAMMAPTEILAEQHYQGIRQQLAPFDFNIRLLTGSTPASEKSEIRTGLASGEIQIAIGTHALIQETVQFKKLALAIIDEQHRFGVDQRQALREKGSKQIDTDQTASPHLLVMSATPIPRSLALSLYGDLDPSILDEMPPGRQEIKTRWLRGSERERGYTFLRKQIGDGRQAYIIYPLVEESDKIDAKAAVSEYERLANEIFPDLRLGLIHGRLKADEKEQVMRAFYDGELDVLVATSVIEVGVDVPNSTLMIIEGANRFGLAQLHQFRGRVGRGEHQSYCLLIADTDSANAEERLSALEKSNDGFALAEKDLELRGPGEFFGRRQSGLPELQLASLADMDTLQIAQTEAAKLFAEDPQLSDPAHKLLQARILKFWETRTQLAR